MKFIKNSFKLLYQLLQKPFLVLMICFAFAAAQLFFSGSLLRTWGLHQRKKLLQEKFKTAEKNIKQVQKEIKQFKTPGFIKKKAKHDLELVEKTDLLFLFKDEGLNENE